MQKATFYRVKGGLLASNLPCFATQNTANCKAGGNMLIINVLLMA